MRAALSGFSTSIIVILMLFQFSASFHSLGISRRPESEIWWNADYAEGANLVLKTIEDISFWNTGVKNGLEIQIQGIKSPSLLWLLRNNKVKTVDELIPSNLAPILITEDKDNLSLIDSYRGQEIAYFATPIWTKKIPYTFTPPDFYRWLFFRDGITQTDEIYLWSRADLFIGNNIKFESGVHN